MNKYITKEQQRIRNSEFRERKENVITEIQKKAKELTDAKIYARFTLKENENDDTFRT